MFESIVDVWLGIDTESCGYDGLRSDGRYFDLYQTITGDVLSAPSRNLIDVDDLVDTMSTLIVEMGKDKAIELMGDDYGVILYLLDGDSSLMNVDGDYSSYGINKVSFSRMISCDRKIVSPDGLFKSIMGDKSTGGEYYYEVWGDGETMTISSAYWRWAQYTSRGYINDLMEGEGLDSDWDYDVV